jgi:hypothetical protein
MRTVETLPTQEEQGAAPVIRDLVEMDSFDQLRVHKPTAGCHEDCSR